MPLINCKINLILTLSADCVISTANRATKFAITVTKLYIPVVTLSANDNAKLLQKFKSGFKKQLNGTDISLTLEYKGKTSKRLLD